MTELFENKCTDRRTKVITLFENLICRLQTVHFWIKILDDATPTNIPPPPG